jgi:hypothetical protein
MGNVVKHRIIITGNVYDRIIIKSIGWFRVRLVKIRDVLFLDISVKLQVKYIVENYVKEIFPEICNGFMELVFMLPEKFRGSMLSVRAHNVLNILSGIDAVDTKYSLRLQIFDQGLPRLFYKVQGHAEHTKESNFKISSYLKFTFYQKSMLIEHTHCLAGIDLGSLSVIFKRSRSLSACTTLSEKKILLQQFKHILSHIIMLESCKRLGQ